MRIIKSDETKLLLSVSEARLNNFYIYIYIYIFFALSKTCRSTSSPLYKKSASRICVKAEKYRKHESKSIQKRSKTQRRAFKYTLYIIHNL